MRRRGRGPLGGEAATARGRSPEARAFFAPGNPAIARQALLISIRACAAALALIGIADVLAAHLVGARLHESSIILTAVWILVVCLARLALGRETDASRSREARRIRRALLEHAFRLGPARIGAEETGRLISLLTDSVERVVEYRQAYIGELIGAVATPFLVLVVVGALIDPVAALVLVACIPFVPLSIALFQRFVRDDSSASREMRARLSAQFLEAIQGLSTLVGIGAADRVGERLARTGEDNRLAVMRVLARNQLIHVRHGGGVLPLPRDGRDRRLVDQATSGKSREKRLIGAKWSALWANRDDRLSPGLVNGGALPTTNVGQGDARPAPRLMRLFPFL